MIKTIRIHIPYKPDQKMEDVLTQELSKVGLTIKDISIKVNCPKYDNNSHYGNWVYIPAKDIDKLHETNLLLDMPAYILEVKDIQNLKDGDKVNIQYTNGLAGQSFETGKIHTIKIIEGMGVIEIFKGRSKMKGFRFYTGESVRIDKI